jgi:NADH-quinone oxidoreductase subunit A
VDEMLVDYLPVFLMVGAVSFLAVALLFVSSWLRPSNPYPEKNQPYECGVNPIGEASAGQFKVHFFIVAILFIVFEVETLYLFPWAVVLQQIGMFGYIEMFVFIFLLLVGFIYAWAKGALEWES